MAKIDKTMRGLLIPAFEQLSKDTLEVTRAAGSSTYTEAGAQPGTPTSDDEFSKLVPEVSAAQDVDFEFEVIEAGMPGPTGVGVRYRTVAESYTAAKDRSWRGWMDPTVITGFQTAQSDNANVLNFQAATRPDTQEIVVIYHGDYTATYSPTTGAWTQTGTGSMSATLLGNVVFLPGSNRRLNVRVLQGANNGKVETYYLDPDGTSGQYSNNPWTGVTAIETSSGVPGRSRLAYHAGDLVLLAQYQDATSRAVTAINQFASSDLGASWRLVDARATTETDPEIVSLNGTLFYFYIDVSTSRPSLKTFSSGFEKFSEGSGAEITTDTAATLSAWADFDGSLYVAYGAALTPDPLKIRKSTDAGATWSDSFEVFDSPSSSTGPRRLCAAASYGQTMLLTGRAGPSGNGLLYGLTLGGFSNVTYSSFGDASANKNAWCPFGLPTDMGWTQGGTAGDGTISAGELVVSSSTSSCFYTRTLGTSDRTFTILVDVKVTASGSYPAAPRCGIFVSDGSSYSYDLDVFIETGRLVIYDTAGSSELGTVTIDCSSSPIQLLISTYYDSAQKAQVWYKRRAETIWARALTNATALSDAGSDANPSLVSFANEATTGVASVVSIWNCLAYNVTAPTENAANTASDVKRLGVSGYPFPEIATGSTCGRLGMRSGPGHIGETFTALAEHTYSVDNLFPTISPSPAQPWRSTDLSEQILSFRVADSYMTTRLGQSWAVGIYLDNCNFRLAYLEAKIGGVWTTIASYNGAVDYTGLGFVRNGELVWPGAGGAGISRFTHRGELIDGYCQFDTSEAPKVRKIVAANSGKFNNSVDMKEVLRLAEIDDTEPSSGTSMMLWPCRGFCVGFLDMADGNVVKEYRLRIPAQPVAESYYQVGVAVMGYFQPFGKQWGDGWSRRTIPNVTQTVSRYGTSRARQEGPPRRRWTMAWPDGVALANLYAENPNYYSGPDLPALVAQDDVWTLAEGLLEEIKGGEVPVVAVAKIPNSAATVTDRTLFCYGRLTSEVQFNQVTGSEGVDEFGRIETITVEEIK